MKRLNLYITYICCAGMLALAACKKATTTLPPRPLPPSLDSLAAHYKALLTGHTAGWYMLYQPSETAAATAIRIQFHQDNSTTIVAGLKGYHEEKTDGSYTFDGIYALQLVFSDNTVFGELSRRWNGFNKFKIELQENGEFALRRADGFDNTTILLSKATPTNTQLLNDQVQAIYEQVALEAATREKLKALIEAQPGYYFNNLLLENFGAYLEGIDSNTSEITLKWRPAGSTTESTTTLHYDFFPGGIKLEPAIQYGAYTIDSLFFGAFDDGAIDITAGGNAGAGKLGWMHIPPYPYQTAYTGAPAGYTTADFFIRHGELPRFFGYTLDDMDTYYSPALQPYIQDLKDYFVSQGFKADEVFRLQFYNNNYNSTTLPDDHATRNQLQLLVRNGAGSNTFQVFFYDLQKHGPNHVSMVSFGTTGSSAAPYKDKVVGFMNEIFTPEGFTVVPAGRNGTSATALQILRLVSRKDSRIWIQLLVANFPTPIYFD